MVDFFGLLGWDLKAHLPFASAFAPLGVQIDFASAFDGRIVVRNKDSRIEELCQAIAGYLAQGFIRPHEARSFRGRFVFAIGQTFGRCGAIASRSLGLAAEASHPTGLQDGAVVEALRWINLYLQHARPRIVDCTRSVPVLIFTDGACEDGQTAGQQVATVGGILRGRGLAPDRFFGAEVPDDIVAGLASLSGRQVIGQIELAPIWLAKLLWHEKLQDTRVLHFVDNNSAKFGLIRGYSAISSSSRLIDACWMLDAELGAASWYSRVASPSNVADAPSRLCYDELLQNGAIRDPVTDGHWDQLRRVLGQ